MKPYITATFILLLFATACSDKSNKSSFTTLKREVSELNSTKDGNGQYEEADTTGQNPGVVQQEQKHAGKDPVIVNPDWDKKIIKNADIDIEVKDYNNFYSSIRDKVRSMGGYVAQEEQSQTEYKIGNTIVIKVPVDQFDNAVVQLSSGATKVNEKKVSSQDVTSEFVDTKSRIEAKKQVRDRYMDLLKQAKNMQEILDVQSEINGIQEEIESATGRVEYLGHSAAFSTINLSFYQVLNAAAKDPEKPVFGNRVGVAFKTGWGWIVDLFVGIVSIWPLCLLVLFAIIYLKRIRTVKNKVEA